MQILPLKIDFIKTNWELIKKIEENSGLNPRWEIQNFMEDLPQKWHLSQVILNNDIIIGYAILSEKSPVCAHLHRIAISAPEQKKGIGSYFLNNLITILKSHYKFLTLKTESELIKKFYLNLDFLPLAKDGQYTVMLRVL